MGEKHRACAVVQLVQHLRNIHAQRARIDVHEHRLQARVQHGSDVAHPGEGGYDHLAFALQLAQGRHGHEVSGRTGMHEHTVFHAEPLAPLALKGAHVIGLGQDGVVLLQEIHQTIQILTRDVVSHQGPWADSSCRCDSAAIFHYNNLRIPQGWCFCRPCGCGLSGRQGTRPPVPLDE